MCNCNEIHEKIKNKAINETIDDFSKRLTDKIELKYCKSDLSSQYIGMQVCDWIKEIADDMRIKTIQ